jgi:hypothetical protein
MRFSKIPVILVDNLFEICQFIDGKLNLMTTEVDLYQIESFFESNGYRIESKGFCNISIKNQIKWKPIRFDSPDGHEDLNSLENYWRAWCHWIHLEIFFSEDSGSCHPKGQQLILEIPLKLQPECL